MKRYRTNRHQTYTPKPTKNIYKKVVLKTFFCIAILVSITLTQWYITPFGMSVNDMVKEQLNKTTNIKQVFDSAIVYIQKIK